MWENSVMRNSKMWLELGAIYMVRVVSADPSWYLLFVSSATIVLLEKGVFCF